MKALLSEIAKSVTKKCRFQNLSNEPRTLDALLSSSSIFYTGVTANPISRAHGEFVLGPGQSKTDTYSFLLFILSFRQ